MKLGVIGCGKMGSALVCGATKAGVVDTADVLLFDAYPAAAEDLAEKLDGAVFTGDVAEVVEAADMVLICVKPGDVTEVLTAIKDAGNPALVVSIAAGVTLKTLESGLGAGARAVRVMPNTPALVGEGASAFALGCHASDDDASLVSEVLGGVGVVKQVPEKLMDAVTGLSGSGPAYVYTIIEAMADGGVKNGLPRDVALTLAAQTVLGAARMVIDSGEHPAVLRDQVTSPGGTTIAGLSAMENAGVRAGIIAAVDTATARSIELGK